MRNDLKKRIEKSNKAWLEGSKKKPNPINHPWKTKYRLAKKKFD